MDWLPYMTPGSHVDIPTVSIQQTRRRVYNAARCISDKAFTACKLDSHMLRVRCFVSKEGVNGL